MTPVLLDPLRLTRRDPERNMARFYALALEPTLFGEVTLLRTWGRIGTRGQVRIETFGEADQAVVAREKLARAKRKKGYCV
jgi:predicted DNA-binding WGR domain protein